MITLHEIPRENVVPERLRRIAIGLYTRHSAYTRYALHYEQPERIFVYDSRQNHWVELSYSSQEVWLRDGEFYIYDNAIASTFDQTVTFSFDFNPANEFVQ